MKSIEDQAAEYAEALNDIADFLGLPTGSTAQDVVCAVQIKCGETERRKNAYKELHRIAWRLARALDCARGHGFRGGSAELADWSFYSDSDDSDSA